MEGQGIMGKGLSQGYLRDVSAQGIGMGWFAALRQAEISNFHNGECAYWPASHKKVSAPRPAKIHDFQI